MEIINKSNPASSWSNNKRFAIQTTLYYTSTRKPVGREPELLEIEIDSSDDFLRKSIEIGKFNQESLDSSIKLNNPYYTEKMIVLL